MNSALTLRDQRKLLEDRPQALLGEGRNPLDMDVEEPAKVG
jgi:hypothetical protein